MPIITTINTVHFTFYKLARIMNFKYADIPVVKLQVWWNFHNPYYSM
jgi:hypothetical protein